MSKASASYFSAMHDISDNECRSLLDVLPCYVTLRDRDLKVLWANAAVVRDFGDPVENTACELFGIDRSNCADCPVEKTFQDGEVHGKEFTFTKRDGRTVEVVAYSTPVRDEGGRIVSVALTATGLGPVKNVRNQLMLLGQTVAGMAHGIKNIMMGLDGGIYVVNKGLEAGNRDEVKEGWEMVLLNFDKISHIVKDILYCSKERQPNFKKIFPNEIALQIYRLFKDVAASFSIEIRLDLNEEVKEAVIDPDGLHTVLSNLVGNAMDACKIDLWKDEHVIDIRTRRRDDRALVVEVADNGVGMDKTVKDHVFEDFFSSKGNQGTGLGLLVTQKILREHGGKIAFTSGPNQGTTFTAVFPWREEADQV
ncbi:MAG: ATP-binding protein [Pseudomonadota bacterium]